MQKIAIVAVLLMFGVAREQVFGSPGDGIPDFYYFQDDTSPAVLTTFGLIDRPGGTMVVDTDGYDAAHMLIGGKNVSTLALGCDLCDGMNLPQSSATSAGTYTVGYGGVEPNGSSRWIRTAPLQGLAFRGVIGTGFVDSSNAQQPWPADFPPFLDYPVHGLANYGAGLTVADFPKVFNDGATDALWSVRIAGDTATPIYTNVTIVYGSPPRIDFNNDSLVDCADADALVFEIAFGSGDLIYDLNDDQVVNTEDLELWLSAAGDYNLGPGLSYLPADATLDGVVDGSDFIVWSVNKFGPGGSWCGADFNADGIVDGQDLITWNTYKFTASDSASAVPEPHAAWLWLLGVVSFVFRQRE